MTPPIRERFKQAYRDLDLFPLLEAEDIERFRVDYGGDTLARLEQVVDDGQPGSKVVFTGHRGCGKSTLLYRFSREIRELGYFVVFFSIADLVEMSAVDHINILYGMAIQLLSQATKREITIPDKVQRDVLGWFDTERRELEVKDRSRTDRVSVGVGNEELLNFVAMQLKNEASFREEITKTYSKRVTDLVRQVEAIARAIEQKTKKQVLVIIDDLDKLDLAQVQAVYRNNLNALFQPEVRVIFTIPIAVIRDIELRTMLQSAAGSPILSLEVMKFFSRADRHRPDLAPDSDRLELLLAMLYLRLDRELLEPETAKKMVLYSGGVLRELVRIARACCSQCSLRLRKQKDLEDLKINDEILGLALQDLRNEFSQSLGAERYGILQTTYEQGEPEEVNDPEFLQLLHGLYVLEYRDETIWYDVNPIVVDLLKQRNLV